MSVQLLKGSAGRLLVLVLLFNFLPHQGVAQTREAASAQLRNPELSQKFDLAEAHHDLAELYIKKGELDKAMAEARQIIQLRFPPEFEELVGQSVSIITEKFAEIHRFDLGQTLLDEALKATEASGNRAKILATKARLYRLAGDNDRAIESWRRALELEGGRSK
jgi:tetratricopeptide (TPR) repeat protein